MKSALISFILVSNAVFACQPGEFCENGGYKPTPEEELLSKIVIRHFIQNEGDLRAFLPYDKALIKTCVLKKYFAPERGNPETSCCELALKDIP